MNEHRSATTQAPTEAHRPYRRPSEPDRAKPAEATLPHPVARRLTITRGPVSGQASYGVVPSPVSFGVVGSRSHSAQEPV